MSIPLILASKSKPRRDVLYSAGICPTIRVSHVDEPAALEAAAREEGVTVDDLSIKQRVMILAVAKAEAVHRAYRDVADTAAAATGDRVIAYPLKAKEIKDSEREAAVEDLREAAAGKPIDYSKAEIATTRDFSGIDMPTVTEPIATAIAGQPGLTEATVGPLILGCDSMFLLDGECYGKPHSESVARERLKRMSGATGELWTGHCLIDFATGRTVRGASHAKVHFGEFTDADIERYIATGEPLEVAGSFTLEGFGGVRSSTALRAIRTASSASACRWPGIWPANWASRGPTCGMSAVVNWNRKARHRATSTLAFCRRSKTYTSPAMAGWTAPAAASIGAPTVLPVSCWLAATRRAAR